MMSTWPPEQENHDQPPDHGAPQPQPEGRRLRRCPHEQHLDSGAGDGGRGRRGRAWREGKTTGAADSTGKGAGLLLCHPLRISSPPTPPPSAPREGQGWPPILDTLQPNTAPVGRGPSSGREAATVGQPGSTSVQTKGSTSGASRRDTAPRRRREVRGAGAPGCSWWKSGKGERSGSKARTNHEQARREPGANAGGSQPARTRGGLLGCLRPARTRGKTPR